MTSEEEGFSLVLYLNCFFSFCRGHTIWKRVARCSSISVSLYCSLYILSHCLLYSIYISSSNTLVLSHLRIYFSWWQWQKSKRWSFKIVPTTLVYIIFTPFCWVRLGANYIFTPVCWVSLEGKIFLPLCQFWGKLHFCQGVLAKQYFGVAWLPSNPS